MSDDEYDGSVCDDWEAEADALEVEDMKKQQEKELEEAASAIKVSKRQTKDAANRANASAQETKTVSGGMVSGPGSTAYCRAIETLSNRQNAADLCAGPSCVRELPSKPQTTAGFEALGNELADIMEEKEMSCALREVFTAALIEKIVPHIKSSNRDDVMKVCQEALKYPAPVRKEEKSPVASKAEDDELGY